MTQRFDLPAATIKTDICTHICADVSVHINTDESLASANSGTDNAISDDFADQFIDNLVADGKIVLPPKDKVIRPVADRESGIASALKNGK